MRVPTELLHYGEIALMGAFHTTPSHFWRVLNLIAFSNVKMKL